MPSCLLAIITISYHAVWSNFKTLRLLPCFFKNTGNLIAVPNSYQDIYDAIYQSFDIEIYRTTSYTSYPKL